MPRVVLAIRARPKGVSLKPAVSPSPEPCALSSPGVTASSVTIRSCRRPGPERPTA